jgi:hypothetical protein
MERAITMPLTCIDHFWLLNKEQPDLNYSVNFPGVSNKKAHKSLTGVIFFAKDGSFTGRYTYQAKTAGGYQKGRLVRRHTPFSLMKLPNMQSCQH